MADKNDLRKRARERRKRAISKLDSTLSAEAKKDPADTSRVQVADSTKASLAGKPKASIDATIKDGKAVGKTGKEKEKAETLFKLQEARRKTSRFGGPKKIRELVKSKKMDPKHPIIEVAATQDSLSQRLLKLNNKK